MTICCQPSAMLLQGQTTKRSPGALAPLAEPELGLEELSPSKPTQPLKKKQVLLHTRGAGIAAPPGARRPREVADGALLMLGGKSSLGRRLAGSVESPLIKLAAHGNSHRLDGQHTSCTSVRAQRVKH